MDVLCLQRGGPYSDGNAYAPSASRQRSILGVRSLYRSLFSACRVVMGPYKISDEARAIGLCKCQPSSITHPDTSWYVEFETAARTRAAPL